MRSCEPCYRTDDTAKPDQETAHRQNALDPGQLQWPNLYSFMFL